MRRAAYPGSFDPFTNGHLDILDRALLLFDEVIIVVAGTGQKNPLLKPEERVALIKKATQGRKNVRVELWGGLIMDYAEKNQIGAIIRGLRAASDFEYEFMMAAMNKELNGHVETVFLMTAKNLFFVSSSMVRELHRFGGDISPYVPKEVASGLKGKGVPA